MEHNEVAAHAETSVPIARVKLSSYQLSYNSAKLCAITEAKKSLVISLT